jgi:hypothetical protein
MRHSTIPRANRTSNMPKHRSHSPHLARTLPPLLAAACWLSFAAFVVLSESLRRFCRELLQAVGKM